MLPVGGLIVASLVCTSWICLFGSPSPLSAPLTVGLSPAPLLPRSPLCPGVSGDFWGSQEGCQGPSRPSGRNRGLPLRRTDPYVKNGAHGEGGWGSGAGPEPSVAPTHTPVWSTDSLTDAFRTFQPDESHGSGGRAALTTAQTGCSSLLALVHS